MKDERANIKLKKETRDRLMATKYALREKSIDDLINSLLDIYAEFADLRD